jgi:WXXGXW repeat (2 copies)
MSPIACKQAPTAERRKVVPAEAYQFNGKMIWAHGTHGKGNGGDPIFRNKQFRLRICSLGSEGKSSSLAKPPRANIVKGRMNSNSDHRVDLPAFRIAALGVTLALLSGCVVREVGRPPREVVVEAPPPPPPRFEVVQAAPPPPSRELVVIREAPPPPRREVMVERERPSPEHVWIGGYWALREGKHAWVAGHWEKPPHPKAVWVEPRWEKRGSGYVFIEGVWR